MCWLLGEGLWSHSIYRALKFTLLGLLNNDWASHRPNKLIWVWDLGKKLSESANLFWCPDFCMVLIFLSKSIENKKPLTLCPLEICSASIHLAIQNNRHLTKLFHAAVCFILCFLISYKTSDKLQCVFCFGAFIACKNITQQGKQSETATEICCTVSLSSQSFCAMVALLNDSIQKGSWMKEMT